VSLSESINCVGIKPELRKVVTLEDDISYKNFQI
jgi:hypothetical protein